MSYSITWHDDLDDAIAEHPDLEAKLREQRDAGRKAFAIGRSGDHEGAFVIVPIDKATLNGLSIEKALGGRLVVNEAERQVRIGFETLGG